MARNLFSQTSIKKIKVSRSKRMYSFNVIFVPKGNKGGMQAKGIWKQDPEGNFYPQKRWEKGVEKAPQWGTS